MDSRHLSTAFASAGFILALAPGVSASDAGAAAPTQIAAPDPLGPNGRWRAEGDQTDALFGNSVGTAGDVNGDGYDDMIVGAPGLGTDGSVHVYHGSAHGPSTAPDWTAVSNNPNVGSFGASVGTAGDVNGDGYDDVVIGAPAYLAGAFVYHGSALGLSTTPDWTALSDDPNGRNFGGSVGTAGDINGDGYDDVIIGADRYYNDNQLSEGWAFVYYGSALGLSQTPDWSAESNQSGARFGISVGTAGDVNSDGYDDVIIGAFQYENGQSEEGRAFVYHGSASGLGANPDWIAESDRVDAQFGYAAGTAGDVDGDGYDDVIIGAFGYDNGGAAFVYKGSASGLSTMPDWTGNGNQAFAYFGYSVGTAGDINGDGFDDVVVGAPNYDHGQTGEGASFAYYGSASGLPVTPDWTAESDQFEALFGHDVGSAGDVNGDGYGDGIVGAVWHSHGQRHEGGAVAYRGRTTGLSPR